jgi:hypothetical protein
MSRKQLAQTLLNLGFVSLGVLGAFLLYEGAPETEDGQAIFSFTSPSKYPVLVAMLIAGISAILLCSWVLISNSKTASKSGLRAVTWLTLISVGFAAGLFGPVLMGSDPVWNKKSSIGQSVLYEANLDLFELSDELKEFWTGDHPGPYISSSGSNLWMGLNSEGPPKLLANDSPVPNRGEAMIATFELSHDRVAILDWINLTSLDPQIQHLRDVEMSKDVLGFTNVSISSENCLVLQLWTFDTVGFPKRTNPPEKLWESQPCLTAAMSPEGQASGMQSGGRLEAAADGSWLISVGDFRMGLSVEGEYLARQDVLTREGGDYGKILRVSTEGEKHFLSSGHRNPQGLVLDSRDGSLWSSEHGPLAGGELNLIQDGKDYGWPDVTYGIPYGEYNDALLRSGRYASDHTGFEKPILAWLPSIGPSQMIVYGGENFPLWEGDLIMATLADESLRRLRLQGKRVIFDERIEIGKRVRDLIELPDGTLLMSFDNGELGVLSYYK